MTIHLSVALDEERHSRLEKIAKHEDLSVDELVDRLIQERLEYEAWFVAEVQKGVESAARGEVVSHAEVMVRGRRHLAELRAQQAR